MIKLFRILFILVLINMFIFNLLSAVTTVRSASEYNYPPLALVTNGEADGFSVDLLRAALNEVDMNVSYYVGPWSEIKMDLAEGKIDALPLVGRTPERESLYDFTVPYLTMYGAIFVKQGISNISSIKDLSDKNIVVMKGDNAEEFIRREQLSKYITTTTTFEEAFLLVSEGKQDAVITQKLMGIQLLKNSGIENVIPIAEIKTFKQDFTFAVKQGNKELLTLINDGLSKIIIDGTYDEIYDKWFCSFDSDELNEVKLSSKEKDFIKAHPIIRFGTDASWAPYISRSDDGSLTGFEVGLINLINEYAGTNIQIVTGHWKEIVEQAKNREIDGLATSATLKARELHFTFSDIYVSEYQIVLIPATSNLVINKLSDLTGKTVAIQAGNEAYYTLIKDIPDINVLTADTESSSIKLMVEGKADASIASISTYIEHWHSFGQLIRVGYIVVDNPLDLVYSVRKDWPELVSIINKALESIPSETKNNLIFQWFGFDPSEIENGKEVLITLTANEKAWISKHPEITLGGGISFAPFIMYDNDGNVIGYDAEIAKLVAKRTGLKINFELGKWAEIQERARNRELDGISTANFTKEREKYYNASRSLIHLTPLVIVKRGNPKDIHSLEDIVGKRVALQKGNALINVLEDQTKEFEAVYVESMQDIIKAVVSEKADFAILEESAFYIANQIGLGNMIESPFTIGEGMDTHFLLRNDWPLLHSIIDKGLKSISISEKLELRRKWLAIPQSEIDEERIILTAQEQTWIREHPEIRLGVDPSWQPFDYIDDNGQHQGIASDYIRILNKRLGINMKILPDMSWMQLIEVMPERGVDVFSSVVKTPEREKYLSHTEPYLYLDWVVVRPHETSSIKSLEDFEGRIVAVIDGYVTKDFLEKQYPKIKILPGETTFDVLQSVIDGKADAAFVERITANMIIHAHRMYSLEIDQHVIQNNRPLSLAARNDWPELVQILNKGLSSITPEERKRIEKKWLAVPIQIGFTREDVLRIVLYVIAFMGIFLVLSFFWNQRLKKEIFKRNKAEKEIELKSRELEIQLIKSEKHRIANLVILKDLNKSTKKLKSEINDRERAEELLRQKMSDLEIFNDAAVDREIAINDLRKEINELLVKVGKEAKYEIVT
jgi:ABC-type amino acid transport substrate-binding protein